MDPEDPSSRAIFEGSVPYAGMGITSEPETHVFVTPTHSRTGTDESTNNAGRMKKLSGSKRYISGRWRKGTAV